MTGQKKMPLTLRVQRQGPGEWITHANKNSIAHHRMIGKGDCADDG